MVGFEIPYFYCKNMRGVENYIVFSILNQSKQPARSSRLIGEGPKGRYFQKRSEFGISRNTKVWGKRRIHSTVFICGKGSSKFMIGDAWFEGQEIKNQFQKLLKDLKYNKRANNLTTILSSYNFLIGCYLNIKLKPSNLIQRLSLETINDIDKNWFKEVVHTFRNGKFNFCPCERLSMPISKGKFRPFIIPSLKDQIIQEGMKILLECIFNNQFRDSSHAFRPGRGSYTALNQIRLHFGKSNWFIKGDINQQYRTIDHNILVNILREKIQDEPFIDLIYKYMRVGYGEKSNTPASMKLNFIRGGLISPILFNIYMHSFDKWMEDVLILKYTKKKRKKDNLEHSKMIREHSSDIDKDINVIGANSFHFRQVTYVRYMDDFLIGVIGSKETCMKIREEVKVFLESHLAMTINIDETHITHSKTGKVLFLGYDIFCISGSKMLIERYLSKQLFGKTNQIILNAPIKRVVENLQLKGFLNRKKQPTRCGRYINIDLWSIVDSYKSIEQGVMNYYFMADNYRRLAARVHYSLKYSCALTISSKMKLKTMRRVFKCYGKNLKITIGEKSISYSNISYKRPQKNIFKSDDNFSFEDFFNNLVYSQDRCMVNLKGSCVVCGSFNNIKVYDVRALKGISNEKDWLFTTMYKYSRNKVSVCKYCYIKIHKGIYVRKNL
jgi:retron-type reverse transcriptase